MLILSSVGVFLFCNINKPFVEDIDELHKQLITISGIFTALMLTILMPFFIERANERQLIINEYNKDCKRVAAFRAFVYHIRDFDMFESSSSLQFTYLKGRSFQEYKESSEFFSELYSLSNEGKVKGENIGRMELYGAIRDFAYDFPSGISFFSKYSEYTYSYEKLQYIHYCCNMIWYSLDRHNYLRQALNRSYSFHSTYWIGVMEKLIPFFSIEKTKLPLKDPANFVMSQAGEYEQIISNMLNKMHKILFELSPQNYSSISLDTIFILLFGLIMPLYTLLFKIPLFHNQVTGLICFTITITFIINFLIDVYKIFNKDNFKEKYENETRPLFDRRRY
ncbi:hypothetical protein [Hymenobacter aerophilus]|uniref:hypothetical protein n=1 Tax=Hymenobacter aerophilus TaxID=119644 RepID=UPI0012F8FE71|nr:hypothetical protein [Hymenobacter aerophilus]